MRDGRLEPGAAEPGLLTDEARRRFGVEPGWAFAIPVAVRWADVDAFGHANHTSFLRYCEDARNAYLEAVGLPRLTMTTPGPVMTRVEASYLRALAYGDRILVTARTASLRRRSFAMAYAAWRDDGDGDGGCCARCTAVFVLMINATGEKVPIPEPVRAAMARLDSPAVEA